MDLIYFYFDCRMILGYEFIEIMKIKEKNVLIIVVCRKKCFIYGKMCLNLCKYFIYIEIFI